MPATPRARGGRHQRLSIRPLTRKDGPAFLALIRALAEFERLEPPARAARARLLRDAFGSRKRFQAYIAHVGTEAAGYAIIFETYSSFVARPSLFLEDLFVLPAYRKQGVGQQLFRTCLAEAKRRHCGRMEWVVLDWNVNAIRFYESLGARQLRNWILNRLVREDFQPLLARMSRGRQPQPPARSRPARSAKRSGKPAASSSARGAEGR